jgi:CBS domain-containing protein
MTVATKPLLALTAGDLMSRPVVTVPPEMHLREAARVLAQEQFTGVSVVGAGGQCVGVLSATDFVRWAAGGGCAAVPRCTMPPAASHWRVPDLELLPAETVEGHMMSDPVMVSAGLGIRELARLMLDAHIHRVGVVAEDGRLSGMVSGTDILVAVAYADCGG